MKTICTIDECNEAAVGRGYCHKHYKRWQVHGNPMTVGSKRIHWSCTVLGCGRPHRCKGYCKKHYDTWRRNGDPIKRKIESHGMTETSEYRIWQGIKARCRRPDDQHYRFYGGRGITVCDRWFDSFSAFYKDMGQKPFQKAQIDRINNDGNYEPENCRWTTCEINNQNRSFTKLDQESVVAIRNEYKEGNTSYMKIAKKYGVSDKTIHLVVKRVTWRNVK